MTSGGLAEAEGPVGRPTGWFEQPLWTVLGLLVVCAGPLILLAGVGGLVPEEDRTAVVVTGLVWTPLTAVVLFVAVVGTVRDRRVWRALDTAGVRVVGEVTSAQRVWCGEDDRCTRVRMLVAVPGRRSFTTTHLVPGERVVEVGSGIPVEVHPTRDLFRLVSDPSTGAAAR